MSDKPELVDDDTDQRSLPTSSSDIMSLSPKSNSEMEQISSTTTGIPLIVSNIHEISEEINSLDFTDHLVSADVCEKIIIALDRSKDEEITHFTDRTENSYTPLSLLKNAVQMFVKLKSSINKKHEFALILLNENKATWHLNFTNNVKEFIKCLDSVKECVPEDIFDLNSLFTEIHKKIEIPKFYKDDTVIPPPYVVRTVLMYNRSYTCPEIEFTENVQEMLEMPFFYLDVLVSHEPIDAANNCEKIFFTLQNIDKKGYSYFFTVGRDIETLMRSMAKLLGHPLQRPSERIANYSFC